MSKKPDNLHTHFCKILTSIEHNRGSLSSLLSSDLKRQLGSQAGLLQQWCFGVCRWYQRLDFMVNELLERPLRRKDADIHALLLLGVYQLYFMRTPDHAVLNETVSAAESLGKPWAKGLINAVLREAQRTQSSLQELAAKDYAIWYSHPQWLLDQLKADWPGHYRNILDANNLPAPMALRVNTRKLDRSAYLQLLQQAGIKAHPGLLSPAGIILETPVDVTSLPGFADGYISVQDEASQLVATLLPVQPKDKILDACAAPGGKACALLEHEPSLDLLALDNQERRLGRITENLDRLGLSATVSLGDITRQSSTETGLFDGILLDVPCSATGVIRRHPDIKCLRRPQDITLVCETQAALLKAAWPQLKSGGYLLYTTCSVLRAENDQQITRFISDHPDASLISLEIPYALSQYPGAQLLPSSEGHDGFYYALLRKY